MVDCELNPLFLFRQEMCHKYWPTEKSERYYYYVIEPVNETRHPHFCVREFKVTDARVRHQFIGFLLIY